MSVTNFWMNMVSSQQESGTSHETDNLPVLACLVLTRLEDKCSSQHVHVKSSNDHPQGWMSVTTSQEITDAR
jgi:hypothetical protein